MGSRNDDRLARRRNKLTEEPLGDPYASGKDVSNRRYWSWFWLGIAILLAVSTAVLTVLSIATSLFSFLSITVQAGILSGLVVLTALNLTGAICLNPDNRASLISKKNYYEHSDSGVRLNAPMAQTGLKARHEQFRSKKRPITSLSSYHSNEAGEEYAQSGYSQVGIPCDFDAVEMPVANWGSVSADLSGVF